MTSAPEATAAVLIAALISHFSGVELDGYMSAVVAAVIIFSGIELIKDTISPLLGQPPEQELVDYINNKTMSYDGILGVHDLIIHDYGPGRQFASIHAEVPAETNVLESHEIIDRIESDFKAERNILVVIHLDPVVTSDPRIAILHDSVVDIVQSIDPLLKIHDFRMVPGQSNTNLIFDCLVPYGFEMSDEDLEQKISELVAQKHPNHVCIINVDKDFAHPLSK